MKTFHECLPCFVNQALSTIKRAGASAAETEEAMRAVFREMAGIDLSAPPPVTGTRIYRTIRDVTKNADPFAEDKKRFNLFALSLLPAMRRDADSAADPFLARVRLAIASNIIDFGKNGSLTEEEAHESMERALSVPVDEAAAARLKKEIAGAESVLYLCDNAGEIVFDRLFIEKIPFKKVTCAVRGAPAINDATMEDARETGLTSLVRVISNGSDAPGTILAECSEEFKNSFADADLVIAKGQGNFETLSEVKNKTIFFLLQIKCPVIARDIGFPVGTFAIKENNRAGDTKPAGQATTLTMEASHG
jgi:uncharacterized protein with ATP-grasp and redox domains